MKTFFKILTYQIVCFCFIRSAAQQGPTSSVRRGLVKQPNLLKKAIGRLGKNAQPKKRQLRTHAVSKIQYFNSHLKNVKLKPILNCSNLGSLSTKC